MTRHPPLVSLRVLKAQAAYHEARAEYLRWARIEDALTNTERRAKATAAARVDATYAAYARARGIK